MSKHAAPDGNVFISLRPSPDLRDRLTAISDRLRAWELPATWTHPEDFHLTMLFLGPLDDEAAGWIPAAVDDFARALAAPRGLRLAGLGAAGGSTVPQTVFAAVDDPDRICAAIHRDLAEVLDESTNPSFKPHFTLARPKAQSTNLPLMRDWPHLLEAHGLADWGECSFDAGQVLRSQPTIPRYQALATWPLR